MDELTEIFKLVKLVLPEIRDFIKDPVVDEIIDAAAEKYGRMYKQLVDNDMPINLAENVILELIRKKYK